MAKQGKHERKDQPASTEGQRPSGKSPECQRPRYQVKKVRFSSYFSLFPYFYFYLFSLVDFVKYFLWLLCLLSLLLTVRTSSRSTHDLCLSTDLLSKRHVNWRYGHKLKRRSGQDTAELLQPTLSIWSIRRGGYNVFEETRTKIYPM